MQVKQFEFADSPYLGRVEQACQRYAVGENTMRRLAKDANAIVRYGRCWLVNYRVLDAFIDGLTGGEVKNT